MGARGRPAVGRDLQGHGRSLRPPPLPMCRNPAMERCIEEVCEAGGQVRRVSRRRGNHSAVALRCGGDYPSADPGLPAMARRSPWPVRSVDHATRPYDQAFAVRPWRSTEGLQRHHHPRDSPRRGGAMLSQPRQDNDERTSRLPSLPRRVGPVPPRAGPGGAAGSAMAALSSAPLPADRGGRTHDRIMRPGNAARSARPGDIAAPWTARPSCWRYLLHAP